LLQSTHSNGLEAEHQLQAGKHTAVEKTKRQFAGRRRRGRKQCSVQRWRRGRVSRYPKLAKTRKQRKRRISDSNQKNKFKKEKRKKENLHPSTPKKKKENFFEKTNK